MMKNNDKRKGNNTKKLIPAAGMLALSASMLATSTYAWFTMSREVEVNNIQMTATTPEDIQISLGKIYDNGNTPAATTSEDYSLTGSTGWLKLVNGEAEAPREGTGNSVDPKHELDWSNSADISKYYEFGKLIPASSTDGANVFYTPDAGGVGRTLKASASFYQAAEGLTAYKTGGAAAVGNNEDSAKATAHILTSSEIRGNNATLWSAAGGGYTKSTEWKATNDDGYYIDIPVWLRTSSKEAPKIYVTGYVTDKTEEDKNDTDDLYKAVRVAILDSSGAADKGCLALTDGGDTIIDPITGNASHVAAFPANLTAAAANILDSNNYNNRAGDNTGKIYAVNATTMTAVNGVAATSNQKEVSHGEITVNNAAADNNVATLTAGTGTEYGASTKLIVRIWLEGEDINCWNENAGQDWNIALKFSKDPLA